MINTSPGQDKGQQKAHIQILDFLRGIAALSVVLFHFANSNMPSILPNPLGEFFSNGKLGVQVFFVISGFIIPYAMYQSGYKIKNAFEFLLKRIARIGPPSWVAILLVAGIHYGSLYFNGRPVQGMNWPGTEISTILANITYSYALFDIDSYIDVYWTLEVEFQFYVMMALLLPLIIRYSNSQIILSILLAFLSSSFLFHDSKILFFQYNAYFILGILLFLYRCKKISRDYFMNASIVTMIVCYAQQGLPGSFAAAIAFLIIAFVKYQNPLTTFLGKISYSLYITHFFSGAMAEFVLKRFTGNEMGDPMKVMMLFIYTLSAVAFAWIFYVLIEKPSINLSQKLSVYFKKR